MKEGAKRREPKGEDARGTYPLKSRRACSRMREHKDWLFVHADIVLFGE